MSKPIIFCIADAHRELEALLRPQPNDAYALECFESIDEARVWIEQALKSGTELVGALIEDFRDAELPVMVHRLPEARDRAPETLRAMLGDILTRFELDGLRARNQLLESLSDVGVALAGSFDIQAILRKTREAAEQLAKGRMVEGQKLLSIFVSSNRNRTSQYSPDAGAHPVRAALGRRPNDRFHCSRFSQSSDGASRLCWNVDKSRSQQQRARYLWA